MGGWQPKWGSGGLSHLVSHNQLSCTLIVNPPLRQNTILARALGVLAAEAAAVTHTPHSCIRIVCGIGKSGHIGRKLVATLSSLGVSPAFLHAAEAVQGDLGGVGDVDVLLFVSFSGCTEELLNVLPHVPPKVPIIALTGHADASVCPRLVGRQVLGPGLGENEDQGGRHRDGRGIGILLPTPVRESEEENFGVGAPTTSIIVAMAFGDMLAATVSERIYGAEKGLCVPEESFGWCPWNLCLNRGCSGDSSNDCHCGCGWPREPGKRTIPR